MMDKESVLINDDELEAVTGGAVDLAVLFSKDTQSEAQKYLVSSDVAPNTPLFEAFMAKWEAQQ